MSQPIAKNAAQVERQIALPLNTAVEIAYKNIRMRLSRSLLVTSGIVLALAFLMSILSGQAITDGMRDYAIHAASPANANKAQAFEAQKLAAAMSGNGLPMTDDEIAANRTQTHWLLGLALLVAFVGILNAMLMSVTERFREIGTMKCLGALDGFIIKLFLLESAFQGVVGTIIGIIIGLLMSVLSNAFNYGGYVWHYAQWGHIAAAVGICLAVGIVLTIAGAVYPAWQAARMQPIDAMRVET